VGKKGGSESGRGLLCSAGVAIFSPSHSFRDSIRDAMDQGVQVCVAVANDDGGKAAEVQHAAALRVDPTPGPIHVLDVDTDLFDAVSDRFHGRQDDLLHFLRGDSVADAVNLNRDLHAKLLGGTWWLGCDDSIFRFTLRAAVELDLFKYRVPFVGNI
jgi:hypothetical protein